MADSSATQAEAQENLGRMGLHTCTSVRWARVGRWWLTLEVDLVELLGVFLGRLAGSITYLVV